MKKAVVESIRRHTYFEIITHEWPDEDAVGSSMALAHALKGMGKGVRLIYPTPVPESLLLPPLPQETGAMSPEISLLVDVSDLSMIRDVKPMGEIVAIDHHMTNQGYGKVAWVDSRKSSTAEMVFDILADLQAPIDLPVAINLYMGIFGDTGGFSHPNTTPRVFAIAQKLTRAGADPNMIANRLKRSRSLVWYHILCLAMERLIEKDGVYASYITLEDIERLHATSIDTGGIVEEMSCLGGAELSVFVRDVDDMHIHCSLRSKQTSAALFTALAFGGGGHAKAAGFSLQGRAKDLIGKVIEEGARWTTTV